MQTTTPTEERKMLSVEELMLPRIKVNEEGYPLMPWKKGEVLTFHRLDDRIHVKPERYFMRAGISYFQSWFAPFPTLFRELQWWEEREESEMPEYLKKINWDGRTVKIGDVFKVLSYEKQLSSQHWFMNLFPQDKFHTYHIVDFTPATVSEYEAQQQKS